MVSEEISHQRSQKSCPDPKPKILLSKCEIVEHTHTVIEHSDIL